MPLLSTRGAASARGFGLLGRVKAITDPFFNYVTMLLHGNGTNGAQNNTFLDSSTNNFTITRNGNTTQGSFSPYGTLWSNYFDGSGDYLRLSSAINLSGDFTAEAFVYSDSTFTGQNQIFGSDLSTADGNKQLYIASSTNKLTIYDGSSASASSGSVPQNQWSHVAITRQGSTLTFYINGVASGTATVTATMSFRIVGGLVTGSGINEQFKGYISNARIVSGTAVYTANFTPSTTPLTVVSGTSLLTCADNRFIDDSANNFAITVFGTPSVQRFSPFAPTAAYSTATIGGSGYFDGSDNLTGPTNNSAFQFGTGDFTVEMWVYTTNTSNFQTLLDTRSGDTQSAWCLFLDNTGKPYWYDASGVQLSSTAVAANTWTHLAVSRSGSTLRMFLSGVQVFSGTNSNAQNPTGTFYVGRNAVNAFLYTGYMTDVRVVKGTAVYTSNFTPPTAPLTAVTNTSVLLNFTNGAIFDNAMMNDLETVGNAQISTSVVKFGTGSISFNGTNSNLLGPVSQNTVFPGNFTVEFWVYKNADKDFNVYFDNRATVGSATGFSIASNSSGQFALFTNNSFAITSASSYATATWFHIAVVRSGSTITLYVNGVSVGTSTNSTAFTDGRLGIGYSLPDSAQYVNGYIDDLRITKGVARYTANFTPPTAAFPNT